MFFYSERDLPEQPKTVISRPFWYTDESKEAVALHSWAFVMMLLTLAIVSTTAGKALRDWR